MVQLKLTDLRKVSMQVPGLFQAVIEAGQLRGDHVLIEREALDRLNDRFFQGIKVGSLVHKALAVPVKVIDAIFNTDLKNCRDCALREIKMNVPKGRH